jgi:uncharacterized UPF0146 family protein
MSTSIRSFRAGLDINIPTVSDDRSTETGTSDQGSRDAALVDRLADAAHLVEVGIGTRSGVAAGLAERGRTVVATDVSPQPVPDGVTFRRDDVTDPDLSTYERADLVYALNCPPELQRPALSVAREVGAGFRFTTLGGDPAVVPVRTERFEGVTLYLAETRGPGPT